MAADADTADGTICTLAIVDEVARHPQRRAVRHACATGSGPRQGRLIGISTAGDDEDSPLGRMRKAAYKLPTVERDGAYRYCRSGDGASSSTSGRWTKPTTAKTWTVVATANPASWQTPEALRRRFDSPSMTPWAWARFACGLWVAGEDAAISAKEWAACAPARARDPRELRRRRGGRRPRLAAGIPPPWCRSAAARRTSIEVHPPTILTPPQDGTSLDAEEVFAAAEAFAQRWPGCMFVLDPEAGGEQLAQRLDRELDAAVLRHSQKPGPMTDASQKLAEAIATRGLAHPDHEELTRHVISASAQVRRLRVAIHQGQGAGTCRSTASIALAMAVRVLHATEATSAEPRPEVEARGSSVFIS